MATQTQPKQKSAPGRHRIDTTRHDGSQLRVRDIPGMAEKLKGAKKR